jgi:hypothetical protein
MHPKIVESFWSDPDIDRFRGAQKAELRLTLIWAITNPSTNCLGIFPVNPDRFAFDTGLEADALLRTMQALPKPFVVDADSGFALVRNYVRYQYGVGVALAKNNMTRTLRREVLTAPKALAEKLFELYPELKPFHSPSEGLGKPYHNQSNQGSSHSPGSVPRGTTDPRAGSPSEGLGKPPAKEKEKEKETATAKEGVSGEGRRTSEVTIPTVAEVITWGEFEGVDPDTCRAFHAYYDGLGWMQGNTPIRNPRAWLKGFADRRRSMPAGKKPAQGGARLDTNADPDELRARLQIEKNPEKRAALEAQLAALT